MPNLQDFGKLPGINFPGESRWTGMAPGGKDRRNERGVEPGVIQDNASTGVQAGGAGLPVSSGHIVLMAAIDINQVPVTGFDQCHGFGIGGKGAKELWMRQAEMIKVKQCVPVIINVLRVIRNRIGCRGEGRNAMDFATQAVSLRQQRGQADGLAPKNTNFQKASRLKFFKE